MALILNIETSTDVCSVMLSQDGMPLGTHWLNSERSHAEQLPLFIEQSLQYVRSNNLTLDAVAISAGPGSYTGLRIGASTAKGICYALGCRLLAVDTLQVIAKGAHVTEGYVVPMLDARRMEVYTALYNSSNEQLRAPEAKIIDCNSFDNDYPECQLTFCGNGSGKCQEVLADARYHFVDNVVPTALLMAEISEQRYQCQQFEDIAYFEPFYLKEYQAALPKKMF